ncbi:MAG TPA: TonB-dependent receptor [Gemmatimonadales bacterium]|nr:TonB-dependent receptor [Gemmatimonadales bacterium]
MIRYSLPRRLVLLAAFCAASAPVHSQTISGSVTGANHPLAGVTVRVLELDWLERTGRSGEFRFDHVPPGTYRVYAGMLGYTAVIDTIQVAAADVRLTLALQPSPIPLPEVVVSASPVARPANEEYQAVASKSRADLSQSTGMSFAEKIADLPGVAARWNGSAPSRPILRGLGDNEVLVLEDGLRMGDIATYDPAHATPIDALSIAQIDVVRGPASVLYGPNTIGGLVNVITNLVPTASERAVSGDAVVEGNTVNDEYAGSANVVLTTGGSAFRVSAGGLHSGPIHIPEGTYVDPGTGAAFALDRMPQSFDHTAEGGLGYAYQGAFGMIGIGGNRYAMNYGIPGVPPNPDWAAVPPTTSRIAQQRSTLELRGLFNTGGSLFSRLRLNAAYNDYTHSEFPTAQDSAGISDPLANHFHKQELNATVQLQQPQEGRFVGTIGLWTDIQKLDISGDQPLGPNSTTAGVAGYAYEEFLAARGTRLQAGVRYDYNRIQTHPDQGSTDSVFQHLSASRLSNAVTASVGVIHDLGRGLTGSFSVARSFRPPTVQELFANGLDAASSTYSIGTSTLTPETGAGLDASLRGEFGRASFQVSPYLNVISNYIYGFLRGDTIQGFPVRQFSATTARLAGFEANLTVAATSTIVLEARSDYVHAEDTRQHVPLPFIPPLRGLFRARYQGSDYTGMIEWRLAARQTRLGQGDTPTPGYAVMNVGVGMHLTQGDLTSLVSLECENVFNTVYRDNLSVIKDFVPQPGRGFRLAYDMLF